MEWVELIKSYYPTNEQETKDRELFLYCIGAYDNILTRNNKLVHITCSAFVINKTRDKALMVHHNIFNSWSWAGGHADGEADLLSVAVREVREETGVRNIKPLTSGIFSIDVLPVLGHVRKGEYVSAHLHLTVTYLFEADEKDALTIKLDENSDVKWIPINQINEFSNEPHMKIVYSKLISKLISL